MAEPNDKRPSITRRRMTPVVIYTTPADAVNETLMVNGMTPEQVAKRQAVIEGERRAQEQQARQQKVRRDQYRARRQAQDKANGVLFSLPMSDKQVDQAIAQEEYAANQPQLRQGRSESERQAMRSAGLLYTPDDIEQARRLAEAHNASFFGSMVAPPISPEMAERNPGYVSQVIRGNAMVLPNAFISGLSFGAPSASVALGNGIRQGWQTAGNVGARVLNATAQGAKAVAPVITNPRWAATAGAITLPAVADAAVTAGDGGGSSGSYAPLILGILTTAGTGYGVYRGYNTLKKAGWNLRALSPTEKGAAIRAASKAPVTERALIPYTGVYQRPDWLGMKSWWERPVITAKEAGLPKPTAGQRVMAQVRNWGVRAPLYYTIGTGVVGGGLDLLQKGRHPEKTNEWFWTDKLTYPSVGLPRDIGRGILGTIDQIQYNDSTETRNDPEMQSAQPVNSTDTIVPVPTFDKAPATTSTQAELDSINKAWFNGEPIQ